MPETRAMHVNDHGAPYADRVRPLPNHDPRLTRGECPACQAGE